MADLQQNEIFTFNNLSERIKDIGIATGYGLEGPGIESRWGARFSAPVQTGPGTPTLAFHPLLVPWS